MPPMQAKRDENRVTTALALGSDGETYPLRVDPSTGRLLISIDIATESTPGGVSPAEDGNNVASALAVGDGDGEPYPLIVDSRNGYLFVDIEVEP